MEESSVQPVSIRLYADLDRWTDLPATAQCMQYDALLRQLEIRLLRQGRPWSVPEGYTVRCRLKKADQTVCYQDATASGSMVTVPITEKITSVPGKHRFVLEIMDTSGKQVLQTPQMALRVWKNPVSEGEVESSSEFQSLEDYARRAEEAARQSAADSASAQQSMTDAQSAAEEAEQSRDSARSYNQACLKVYNAAKSEKEEAKTCRDEAKSYRDETVALSLAANFEALSEEEYQALPLVNPKRLYVVEESHPNNSIVACFPLTETLENCMDPTQKATASGLGFADWDGTGMSFRTHELPELTLTSLVEAGTYTGSGGDQVVVSENSYVLTITGEGTGIVSAPLKLSSLTAGEGYAIACTFSAGTAFGGSMRMKNSSTGATFTLVSGASADAAALSWTPSLPRDITGYDTMEFYGDNTAGTRTVSFTMLESMNTKGATQHKNYITLPANLFADEDYSSGVSFSIRLRTDAYADWTRIFQFYNPTYDGDLYATQGMTGTGYWNSTLVQQMGYSNYRKLTPKKWHTFVLSVKPGLLNVFLDQSLLASAVDSGTTLQDLLSNLSGFTENYLGNSRFADNDFSGLLRDFRVYNKALSFEQVLQLDTFPAVSLYWGEAKLASSGESS